MIQWLYIVGGFFFLVFITAFFKSEKDKTLVWCIGIPIIVTLCLLAGALGCPSIHSLCHEGYPQYEAIN